MSIQDNTNKVYINKIGIGHKEDKIYIDCQPVNRSTRQVYVPLSEQVSPFDNLLGNFQETINGPILGGMVGIFLTLGLFFVVENFLKIMKRKQE